MDKDGHRKAITMCNEFMKISYHIYQLKFEIIIDLCINHQ